jgi:hypothetical protein
MIYMQTQTMQLRISRTDNEISFLDVPVYDERRRAQNWFAVIDRKGPGQKISRNPSFFYKHEEKTDVFFSIGPNQLRVGDAVEFAADYISCSGIRYGCRHYGVIIDIADDHIILQQTKTAIQAIKAAIATKEAKAKGA